MRCKVGGGTCPNKVAICDYHAPLMCQREHGESRVKEMASLLNDVLSGADILTDRKWMKRCKAALGDYGT